MYEHPLRTTFQKLMLLRPDQPPSQPFLPLRLSRSLPLPLSLSLMHRDEILPV